MTRSARAEYRAEHWVGYWVGLRSPLLVGGAVLLGALALRLRDPHVQGSWGICPYSLLAGVDCPGCGSLRAVNLLTHGDLVGAASSNLLLVLAAPVAVVAWALWLRRAATGGGTLDGGSGRTGRRWIVWAVVVAVAAGFTVLRNLPAGAWLHS